MVVAWLFDPLVKKLKKKGIKRSIGAIIVYVILIAIIVIVVGSIIPVLIEQINDSKYKNYEIDISLSHIKEYAMATAIVNEKQGD